MNETFRRGEVELLLAEALADRDQQWLQRIEERDREWEAQARAAVVTAIAGSRTEPLVGIDSTRRRA